MKDTDRGKDLLYSIVSMLVSMLDSIVSMLVSMVPCPGPHPHIEDDGCEEQARGEEERNPEIS